VLKILAPKFLDESFIFYFRFPELCTPNSKFLEQFDAITTNSNNEEPIIAENSEETKVKDT